MKVLITGAAGKTGRAIIKALANKNISIRAWVRSTDTAKRDPIAGVNDYFVGDINAKSAWLKSMAGVDKVYHICPNMHPAELEIGRLAIAAATAQNVAHFVYHSVFHPQTEEMPHHWQKMRVEEELFRAGLPLTILQPTAYMQNLAPQLDTIERDGRLTLPYPVKTAISLVDLHDVAAAAAKVLTDERWHFATLELVGTAPHSQREIADLCAQHFGREIDFNEIDLEAWRRANAALASYPRETLAAMFQYYARYGLRGSPAVLTALLERSPTSVAAWLRRVRPR